MLNRSITSNKLKSSELQNKNLKTITIDVRFTIYELYGMQRNVLTGTLEKATLEYTQNRAIWNRITEIKPAKYEWKITDKLIIDKIKNAKDNVEEFNSKILQTGSLKWYLQIYPNNTGKLWIGLKLLYCQPTISQVQYKYKIRFEELDVEKSDSKCTKDNTNKNLNSWLTAPITSSKLKKFLRNSHYP